MFRRLENRRSNWAVKCQNVNPLKMKESEWVSEREREKEEKKMKNLKKRWSQNEKKKSEKDILSRCFKKYVTFNFSKKKEKRKNLKILSKPTNIEFLLLTLKILIIF